MTQSNQAGFDFGNGFGTKMTVHFAGPTIASDGGLLLPKQTETKLSLPSRLALCVRDARNRSTCKSLFNLIHQIPQERECWMIQHE